MERLKEQNRRVLIIDDNVELHSRIRGILTGSDHDDEPLERMEAILFAAEPAKVVRAPRFKVMSAYQGADGHGMVVSARRNGAPFAVAFVDMRMPPGWDGMETLKRICVEDPDIQLVLCTAYSDQSWTEIASELDCSDRLLILKKPFEPIELLQMACSMTEKWIQLVARRSAESRTRALLSAMPDRTLGVDAHGLCWDLRASGRDAPGGHALELPQARPAREVFPEPMADELQRAAAAALSSGAMQQFHYEEQLEDGIRHYEVRVIPADESSALAVLRDATDMIKAKLDAELRQAHEAMLRAQAETLALLSVPLIPIWEDIVVVPLIGNVDVRRVLRINEVLVQGVASRNARVAILDLTGVSSVDAEGATGLVNTANAVRLVGTELVVTGMRKEVAAMLVGLGVELPGLVTCTNLQAGVAHAMKWTMRQRRQPAGALR